MFPTVVMSAICRSRLSRGLCFGEEGNGLGFPAVCWSTQLWLHEIRGALCDDVHKTATSYKNSALASVKSKNITQMETSSNAVRAWRNRACNVQMQQLSSRLRGDTGASTASDQRSNYRRFTRLVKQISLAFPPRERAAPRGLLYPSFLPCKMLRLDITFTLEDGTPGSPHPVLSLWKWRYWHRI